MNQMEDEPQQSFPKQKPQKEASMPVITSDRRTDVCFVNAFRSLGVHVPYLRDGPFWALADGNRDVAPLWVLGLYVSDVDPQLFQKLSDDNPFNYLVLKNWPSFESRINRSRESIVQLKRIRDTSSKSQKPQLMQFLSFVMPCHAFVMFCHMHVVSPQVYEKIRKKAKIQNNVSQTLGVCRSIQMHMFM